MDSIEVEKQFFKNVKLQKVRKKNRLKYLLAEMVFVARMEKGWTQEKLAKKIGTQQPAIARIENGDLVPGLETLEQIAKAFGTDLILPQFNGLILRERVVTQPISMSYSYNEFDIPLSQYKLLIYKTEGLDIDKKIIPKFFEPNCIGAE